MKPENLEDATEFMGISTAFWVWVVLLVACTAGFFAIVEPWFAQKHTDAVRQSQEYITSKQAALRGYYVAYLAIDTEDQHSGEVDSRLHESYDRQRKAALQQMRQAADSLDPKYIPADIREFLAAHKQ